MSRAGSLTSPRLHRREVLKLGATAVAALAAPGRAFTGERIQFPDGESLGRVTETAAEVYARPDPDSSIVGRHLFDEVVVALRRVVGRGIYPHNHVWVETPEGFIWSPYLQPVRNAPNPIHDAIPEEGLWTEISVPYVDGLVRADPLAQVRYRLYYSMVLNVDQRVEGADGRIWYRVNDEIGVKMFAPGECFRQILPEELAPIHPEATEKAVHVNLTRQDLSATEGPVEVYYARISSGYVIDEQGRTRWSTPIGPQWTWRKMVSSHMQGGDRLSGYDLPGVGWTILFSGMGAAIHSTYWHNDFGTARSRGCINARPEDARWLFRWSIPTVEYRPGDVTIQGPVGTRVIVRE